MRFSDFGDIVWWRGDIDTVYDHTAVCPMGVCDTNNKIAFLQMGLKKKKHVIVESMACF